MALLREHAAGDNPDDLSCSPKLQILFHIIKECKKVGEKLLVFSRHLFVLDFIGELLKKLHPDIHVLSFDGSVEATVRADMIKKFQKPDSKYSVFLISTVAGGLGINLTAANRVVLMDINWNPCHDEQAITRVFRFGQKKSVFIYRLLMFGTFDETIYKNTIMKQSLSK